MLKSSSINEDKSKETNPKLKVEGTDLRCFPKFEQKGDKDCFSFDSEQQEESIIYANSGHGYKLKEKQKYDNENIELLGAGGGVNHGRGDGLKYVPAFIPMKKHELEKDSSKSGAENFRENLKTGITMFRGSKPENGTDDFSNNPFG